jgi:hypothetical protein
MGSNVTVHYDVAINTTATRPKAIKGKIVNQNHIFFSSSSIGSSPLALEINEWAGFTLS